VKLVDHEVKHMRGIRCQPLFGLFEDCSLHTSHEHYVEHRVIGDEDVRRMILHVPSGPHLAAIKTLKKPSRLWRASNKLRIAFSAC
jgi:hypothetical protein